MFTKIKKIDKYAVFNNFDWDATVRDKGNNVAKFKDLNIFYGRNYSGKTTLSRIFRSLEKGELNTKYPTATFEFEHTGTDKICNKNIANCSYDIRVYNRDYIKENLKLLTDEDGSIQPFAILGKNNIAIEKEVAENERILGSEVNKVGLKFELTKKTEAHEEKKLERDGVKSALESKLKTKANQDIKPNPAYNDVNYTITKIKADIEKISNSKIPLLGEDKVKSRKKLLDEKSKDDIDPMPNIILSINTLYEKAKELIGRVIKPTRSIQELLKDHLLQEWVRDGIELHKDKRNNCAFCGASLPNDLWDKLEAHFVKESEALRENIKALITEINEEKEIVEKIGPINERVFYSDYHSNLISLKKSIDEEIKKYSENCDYLIKELQSRLTNIFHAKSIDQITNNSNLIDESVKEADRMIRLHNDKTITLNDDQSKAREELRLNEVGLFIRDIGYYDELQKISRLESGEIDKLKKKQEIERRIEEVESWIRELKIKMIDERQGAEKINEYLNHYFGHKGLRFDAIESEDQTGGNFRILRGKEEAHNLSEGECSLVAFCYFMARLEDAETKNKELIIWIDDPVSSLDYNHIFFIFSLIESVLAKPYKKNDKIEKYPYRQLFISTHNLDFLKYLKRLSGLNKNRAQFFLIDKISEKESCIRLMPEYLKKYITEFNYLFHQIYKCTQVTNANEEHECFYNFGNNLRKFLEAYLFYKYPVQEDTVDKLSRFFNEDQAAIGLTNRLDNELSHLEEIFDRSVRPIEIPEIPKLAKYVLSKVREKDPDQYNALLKSIEEN